MTADDRARESRDAARSRVSGSPIHHHHCLQEHPSSPAPPAKRVAGKSERQEGTAFEVERWRLAMPALEDKLREFGYDIEPTQSGPLMSSNLVARRDLEDRVVVIAIDADGRFRAAITWVVGEWPSRSEIAGVSVRVVDAVSRAVTVTGQMDGPEQVAEVVASLRTIIPWASVAGSEPPLP